MKRLSLSAAALAVTLTLPAFALQGTPAQQPSVTDTPQSSPSGKTYPMDQIVTATVHEAWVMSGKNEEAFFDIVEQLAQFSAEKRGVTLPDTAVAGRRMGQYIKTRAKADHDQLLYSIVDQAVRTMGKSAPGASSAAGAGSTR